ncbi:MAG TPA: AraC family transcriptional regulator [Chitinophagaceae bacterium]|nr:AraC family transcriptional regulator [Chitinophagaceae bacterium]
MNLKFSALSHDALVWNNELPLSFKGVRLPGSTVSTSVGEFGSICIQEYSTDNFAIRFNVFDLLQRFVAKTFSEKKGIFSKLILKGRITNEIDNVTERTLYQNQFSLYKTERSMVTEVYEKNIHISFDTFFSRSFAGQLLHLFPGYDTHPTNPKWADAETLEIVQAFLRCKYDKEIRQHYFESRLKDLLLKYLVLSAHDSPLEKEPTEKEIEAINKAEQIISSDIAVHRSIPDLAKRVLLNEFRLKQLFKKIFGAGPYEYLMKKRLTKGKELLEQGLSVKETAAQVGYRPSDFTTSFRNHFGFPPSAIKKRNS